MRIAKALALVAAGLLLSTQGLAQSSGTSSCLWPVCTGIGGGTGDIDSVFGCATGDCDTIDSKTGSQLDMAAGGEAYSATAADQIWFGLPVSATQCSTLVAGDPGQLCYQTNNDVMYVGTTGAHQRIHGHSIVEILGDTPIGDGTLNALEPAIGSHLNFGTFLLSTLDLGLTLPGHTGNCGTATTGEAEGQVCWDRTNDELWIGNDVTPTLIGSAVVVVNSQASDTYTVGTDRLSEPYGGLLVNDDAGGMVFTLPAAVQGMSATFINGDGITSVISVDCDIGDEFIIDGVGAGGGFQIDSGGAAADRISVVAISGSQWMVVDSFGGVGTTLR